MSKRVSVVLQDNVAVDFANLAIADKRTLSQMGAFLIQEAIRVRKASETQVDN